MKPLITVSVLFALASPAYAQISTIHHITWHGSEYNVTDVRAHHHKWRLIGPKSLVLNTVAINKDGDQIEGYPITIPVRELTRADIKAIPDHRPYGDKHPIKSAIGRLAMNFGANWLGNVAFK